MTAKNALTSRKNPLGTTIIAVVIFVAIYVLLNFMTHGDFLKGSNLVHLLSNSVKTSFMALVFCFLITMGIMDLSVGAIIILASNLAGELAVNFNLGYIGLVGGAIVISVALIMLNMSLMMLTKIPPWIFGLGMSMVYEAIATVYNQAKIAGPAHQSVSLGEQFRELGSPPYNFIVLGIGLVAAYILYNRTSVGFSIRAVGSNKVVSKLMGISITKTTIFAGLIAGCFAGIAAAVDMSYAGRVTPVAGLSSIATIFTPLAAFLLSQAFEKIFNITVAVIISAFIITSISNVLVLLGVPSEYSSAVYGGCVLICGVLSQRKQEGVVK
ncbi:ribose import permease protein RbsC [Clostridia bacterium]|nr:ribose import permease protein RbsC [Clostridia bacterium]